MGIYIKRRDLGPRTYYLPKPLPILLGIKWLGDVEMVGGTSTTGYETAGGGFAVRSAKPVRYERIRFVRICPVCGKEHSPSVWAAFDDDACFSCETPEKWECKECRDKRLKPLIELAERRVKAEKLAKELTFQHWDEIKALESAARHGEISWDESNRKVASIRGKAWDTAFSSMGVQFKPSERDDFIYGA